MTGRACKKTSRNKKELERRNKEEFARIVAAGNNARVQ